ncbi:hypothetical protein [Chryseobacterium oryctis]|uniref:Lipopolysaccharide assembly protein A domain-containing protein n=1 Tax=Chryseobacterium oryctis TaxID=2952618 RepID=A0ABT3HM76_9FLAO|nr:hypothetical protein [Chryseobacterium oryctis]MCW3160890.1 hypothetical protein [Chryseobacterium oryctis]
MKGLSLTGLVLLAISILLFYLTTNGFTAKEIGLPHIMGIMGGIGIGLIIGGMVGYISKGSAMKAEQKKKEFKQLQKDKVELEKKAAEIAKRETEIQSQQNQNPQI